MRYAIAYGHSGYASRSFRAGTYTGNKDDSGSRGLCEMRYAITYTHFDYASSAASACRWLDTAVM